MPTLKEDQRLRTLLIKHEGLRLKPYRDTRGKQTIGVGRNLDDIGISELEAMMMLANDIEAVNKLAFATFSWLKSISAPRQDVVLSMMFNMGLGGFKEFKKMIAALVSGNYETAADEMLGSHWASQVGERARELASMMRTGRYPITS